MEEVSIIKVDLAQFSKRRKRQLKQLRGEYFGRMRRRPKWTSHYKMIVLDCFFEDGEVDFDSTLNTLQQIYPDITEEQALAEWRVVEDYIVTGGLHNSKTLNQKFPGNYAQDFDEDDLITLID